MADEPGVTVTLREIYDVVRSTEKEVQALHQKVEVVLAQTADHDKRIEALEQTAITRRGALALISAAGALSGVAAFIVNLGNQLWQ